MTVRLVGWMLIGLCSLGWAGVAYGQAHDSLETPQQLWAPDESATAGQPPCPDCGRLPPASRTLSEHFRQFSRNVIRDFKRNNCWPEPFQRADREAQRLPFHVSVRVAWERQNLISESHFDDDGKLNVAGENKIRKILTEAPIQHRTVYVRRAVTREETERRLGVAREFAVRFVPEGVIPMVEESSAMPASWSPAQTVAAFETLPAAGEDSSGGESE